MIALHTKATKTVVSLLPSKQPKAPARREDKETHKVRIHDFTPVDLPLCTSQGSAVISSDKRIDC
jgi:hypothetical protein